MEFELVSVSDAKVHLYELVAKASSRGALLLRHSKPAAVLVSYEEWLQLKRELEDLKDSLAIFKSKQLPPDLRVSPEKLRGDLGLMTESD